MFSKSQIQHKSTPRPKSAVIPNSFNIKNTPNLTAPPKPPQNLQIKFQNSENYLKFGKM